MEYAGYLMEILVLGILMGGLQSLLLLRKSSQLAWQWFIRTGIGVAVSIMGVYAVVGALYLFTSSDIPDQTLTVLLCVLPFTLMGIGISLFQASLLSGSMVRIYLATAWASSLAAGLIGGIVGSYRMGLEAEAGMFGPRFESGLVLAIPVAVLVYGLATTFVLATYKPVEE
jgi:hypothetical protein